MVIKRIGIHALARRGVRVYQLRGILTPNPEGWGVSWFSIVFIDLIKMNIFFGHCFFWLGVKKVGIRGRARALGGWRCVELLALMAVLVGLPLRSGWGAPRRAV